MLVGDDAVHPAPVRAPRAAELAVRPDQVIAAAAPRGAGRRAGAGINRAVVQAVNVGRSIIRRRARPCSSPTIPRTPTAIRERWERQLPDVPLVIVESPVPRAGRAAGRLPRRPRPRLAAGQGSSDHVRGHPRVRGPPLVGADPLQPVGEAAARGAAGAAAHGRRQRAVPARGARQGSRTRPAARSRPHDRRPRPRRPRTGVKAGAPTGWERPVAPVMLVSSAATAEAALTPPAQIGRGGYRLVADSHGTSVPSRRLALSRRPDRRGASSGLAEIARSGARRSWACTSSRSTGRCRSTRTSPDGRRMPSACSTSPRATAEELQARTSSPCCSRPATSARRSSTRRRERGRRPARARAAVPQAVRRRLRDRPHHPLRPQERALRGVGRREPMPEECDRMKSRHRRLRPGRRRAGRGARRRRPRRDPSSTSSPRAFDRLPADVPGQRRSAATAPTRTSCAGPAPRRRTSSSP